MINVPILVRDALKSGEYKKEYKIDVYNGSTKIKTLDNNYLVSESVKFDERMCSGTDIKFGLCEGSSLEFQYFNHESIKDYRIQAFVDVQYKDTDNTLKWHAIPMGWYTVDSVSRQASTGIMKVTAYNKLQSDYLDSPAPIQTIIAQGECGVAGQISVYTLLREALADYHILEGDPTSTKLSAEHTNNQRQIDYIYGDMWIDGHSYTTRILISTVAIGSNPAIYQQNIYDFYKYTIYVQKVKEYLEGGWYYIKHWDQRFEYNGVTRKLKEWALSGDLDLGFEVWAENTEGDVLFKIDNVYSEAYPDELNGGNPAPIVSISSRFITNNVCLYCKAPTIVYVEGIDDPGIWTTPDEICWDSEEKYINLSTIEVYRANLNDTEKRKISISDGNFKASLRDLQSAELELLCQFGKLDRVTDLFYGTELNNSRLYPADTLYPADNLYPNGIAERGTRAMYSKLWADEGNVRSFRYLIIVYKTIVDGNEVDATLQRTVNANGTDDYNMSDNWLFRNLTWTAADVGAYADAMVLKMQGLRWFPFEMWCAGLPYLETGDEIEINLGEKAHTSYVLNRTLKGIQNLQDEMINGTLDIF